MWAKKRENGWVISAKKVKSAKEFKLHAVLGKLLIFQTDQISPFLVKIYYLFDHSCTVEISARTAWGDNISHFTVSFEYFCCARQKSMFPP